MQTQDLVIYEGNVTEIEPANDATIRLLQQDGTQVAITLSADILAADRFVIEQWLTTKRSKLTHEAYGRDITAFYAFQIERQGKHTITAMNLHDLQIYAASLIQAGLKSSTQARKINCVKSLFSFAAKLEYLRVNTAQLLQPPPVPDELAQRILPEKSYHSMIDQQKQHPRNYALLTVLYYGGLRASEICALRWKHLVSRSYDRDFGGIITVHGKGHKTRQVPVPHNAWQALEQLRSQMQQSGQSTDPDAYVFQPDQKYRTHVPTGTEQLHRNTVRKIVQRAARKAGVKDDVSPHKYRHGHATYAQAHGASAVLVKETLGHKSLVTTTKYSHIVNSEGSGKYL